MHSIKIIQLSGGHLVAGAITTNVANYANNNKYDSAGPEGTTMTNNPFTELTTWEIKDAYKQNNRS